MCFTANEIFSDLGICAERGVCGLITTSTITAIMGTGTTSQPRAWTA